MQEFITKNFKETVDLGYSLGKRCVGGEVFAMYGDLGAGKTTFLQGLAKGLGVKTKVNSPTFNILKLYKTVRGSQVKSFCHIDSYRLSNSKDLESLGINEFFVSTTTVTAIEWAEKVKDILPNNSIIVEIKNYNDGRKIRIKKWGSA